MSYRLVLGLLLALGGGVASWVVFRPALPTAQAQSVDGFDVVRERLRSFDAAYFAGMFGGHSFAIQVSSLGRVAVDPLMGQPPYRYVWRDGEVWTIQSAAVGELCPPILRVPEPPQFRELWTELRSGFASSTVSRTLPSEIGYPYGWTSGDRDVEIVMIQLPFAWASNRRIFLEYRLADGRLNNLLVTDAQGRPVPPPFPVHHRMAEFKIGFYSTVPGWDVPLDPGIFSASYADVSTMAHKKCEHDQGHQHGARLHEEHSDAEIHGEGTPRHHGAWDPSCDAPPNDGPGQSGADHGRGHDADHGQDGEDHGRSGDRGRP